MLIFGSRPKNVRQTGVTGPITAAKDRTVQTQWNSSLGTSCMIAIVYPNCRVPDVLQAHELFNKVTRLEITPDPEQSFLSCIVIYKTKDLPGFCSIKHLIRRIIISPTGS